MYVCGHVTNIWLNCCYAQAQYTKGHLTSIAGSNRRPIQLNLFAISVCGSGWLCVWCSYCQKPHDILNPSLPNDSPGALSKVEREARIKLVRKSVLKGGFLQQPEGVHTYQDNPESYSKNTIVNDTKKDVNV